MSIALRESNPVDWLRVEYAKRRKANPSYSLRAFAKALSIPSGRMSEIFDGKRQLTASMGEKIAQKLALAPEQSNTFLQLIEGHRKDARVKKVRNSEEKLIRKGASVSYDQLSTDTFYLISDWQHYAILNLVETDDFRPDPAWIANRLAISKIEVQTAVDRLERLELLKISNRKWRRTRGPLTTTHDIPSSALRRSHRQSLEQAIEALEEVPVELRDISSITFPIDMSRIAEAKRMILDFRRGLSAFLESGAKEEVYNLNIQLIPVTKVRA